MGKLAINGGTPVRTERFHGWPVFDEREVQALAEVVRSGKWWGRAPGSKVEQFEQKFAAYQDAKHCICTASGTVALMLALKGVGVEPGDEVIVPSYTFIATATAVLDCNAVPVFADIEPGTCNLDAKDAEAKITSRTKAILPVHIGGRPANMDAVLEVARKHGLKVVEDCAQAHGASWRGRKVGAIGDAGGFSFQASKNINAGEGGAVTTNDDEIAELVWSLHNCGRVKKGDWYQHPIYGGNYRMTEWQGAILLVQLERIEEHNEQRTENASYLNHLLKEIPGIKTMDEDERVTRNAYHLFIFRYDGREFNGASKQRFIEAVRAEGIPLSPGYKPLYKEQMFDPRALSKHPFAKNYDYGKVCCPVTERVCEQEAVWLSQSIFLGTKKDMEDIAEAIAKVQKHADEL